MKSNWPLVKLEEVADLTVGFVGTMAKHYTPNGVTFLRSTNIDPFNISLDDIKFISPEFNEKLSKSQLRTGDVVIVRTGKPGACAVIPNISGTWNCSDLVIVRPHTEKLDPLFLAAYINLASGTINNQLVGAVQQHFNVASAKRLEIPLPSIDVQRKISSLIGNLNGKINLNNKINDNLQQQIKLLITAWLVDYVPFGGAIPSDWCSISLSEIAEFVSGYSYKGAELQPSTTAMATIKNFDRNGGFKLDGFKELVPSPKIKPCHYAEKYDVVVAHTDLTQKAEVIGNAEPIINLSGYESVVFSMDLVKVVPKDTRISKFMLAALLQNPRFKAHCLGYVNGTTVLHLNKKALPDYELDFPTDPAVLAPLDDALRVLYMQMATIVDENRKLQDLRDTLLPKLMSGEIDVSDIII